MSGSDFWNERYGSADWVYGWAANDFLRQCAGDIAAGPVLCLGEGEGRNACFLAALGHVVTAVDFSAVALAKLRRRVEAERVEVTIVEADLAHFDLGERCWGAIVSIFAHLPPPVRRRVHAGIAVALRPGGVLVLEGYTPAQLQRGTGGPRDPAMLYRPDDLRAELAGLEIVHWQELARPVQEGCGHTGIGDVLQVVARKP